MRKAGHSNRDTHVRAAVDDLVAAGRFAEVVGKRAAKGYRVVPATSQDQK